MPLILIIQKYITHLILSHLVLSRSDIIIGKTSKALAFLWRISLPPLAFLTGLNFTHPHHFDLVSLLSVSPLTLVIYTLFPNTQITHTHTHIYNCMCFDFEFFHMGFYLFLRLFCIYLGFMLLKLVSWDEGHCGNFHVAEMRFWVSWSVNLTGK